MVSFLLIISFLLHILALFAIFQLFQQLQTYKKQDDSQEVMELLEIHLQEMKEENNRLQTLLEKNVDKGHQEQQSTEEPERNSNKETKQFDAGSEALDLDYLLDESPASQVDASLESRVLQLHANGMKIENIARTLNCGNTEVELIIKLYEKK